MHAIFLFQEMKIKLLWFLFPIVSKVHALQSEFLALCRYPVPTSYGLVTSGYCRKSKVPRNVTRKSRIYLENGKNFTENEGSSFAYRVAMVGSTKEIRGVTSSSDDRGDSCVCSISGGCVFHFLCSSALLLLLHDYAQYKRKYQHDIHISQVTS